MVAFYRTADVLVKVYDEGDDLRASYGTGEFWFSNWPADRRGAVVRALQETCDRIGAAFDARHVVGA